MSALKAYATLAQLRARNQVASGDTSDDMRYLAKLRAASAAIDRYTLRSFQPVVETRKFDWIDAGRLTFRSQELLSLTSVIDGSGRTIDPTAIVLQGGANDATGPYYGFILDPSKAYLLFLTTPVRAIVISGMWGYHDDWANAFHDSGDTVQDASLSASATTITVTNTAGTDTWALTPRFSAGQMIQIDSEWLAVLATASTTLTVVRGINGTTAAVHAQTTKISVYAPPADINEACARWAAFLLAQDDTDFTHSVTVPLGATVIPPQAPPDIARLLDPYVKKRVA
ncbi:MAG TPA: hypothetical protein VMT34_11815 [Aggregatilineales bacterium]|nr:hypothetical protein [Aggregatilineales bacterium]